MAPPPPEIYVQDWSSLGLNMSDLFDSPSFAVFRSGAVESSDHAPTHAAGAMLPTISEDSSLPSSEDTAPNGLSTIVSQSSDVKMGLAVDLPDLADATQLKVEADSSIDPNQETQEAGVQVTSGVAGESSAVSFTGRYAPNALSAVSGLLWDPPSFSVSRSTPLPNAAPALSIPRPQSTSPRGRRDSMVPYPDLFDFSMYTRRISRDSFCEALELPSIAFSVSESSEKKAADSCRPVSIYDVVHERDRYRSAAYSSSLPSVYTSSPRRPPFASTLNLHSERDTVDLPSAVAKKSALEMSVGNRETTDSIGAQFMAACDELSRCEWTEEEFLKMFASTTV